MRKKHVVCFCPMSSAKPKSTYDLVVIGGGPGGSTLASLVAMRDRRVILLEKQQFPRHQIGESLLPSTVHGICRLLGVGKDLESAGFQRKRGGTFLWGSSPTPWTFTFSKHTDSLTGYAYQVERSKFDKILLDNAARLGVEVNQGCTVTDVMFEDGRVAGVTYQDSTGNTHKVSAAFVADAAGHQSQFHRLAGRRVLSQFFQNVALYGYFRNGKRLPEPNAGNILCAAFPEGWFWYIPLTADLTSVGVVISKKAAGKIREGREQAFNSFVNACPLIRDYLSGASRVNEGQYGEFRLRKDYSYCNTAFYRDGLVLIGDAACFVDPVLSSGVHLATYAALLAARSINTSLEGTLSEAACFDEFEYRYRREFGNFYQFLVAFYDMHKDENSYYWEARKTLDSKEEPQEAFVRLVAGLSQEDEAVFPKERRLEVRNGLGEWFESMEAEAGKNRNVAQATSTPRVNSFDFDSFMPGISTEITQIQVQALLGDQRSPENPLRKEGLIPSLDGFHWIKSESVQ